MQCSVKAALVLLLCCIAMGNIDAQDFSPTVTIKHKSNPRRSPGLRMIDDIVGVEYMLSMSGDNLRLQSAQFFNGGITHHPLFVNKNAPTGSLKLLDGGVSIGGGAAAGTTLEVVGGPGLAFSQGRIRIQDTQTHDRPKSVLNFETNGGGSAISFLDFTVPEEGQIWNVQTNQGILEMDAFAHGNDGPELSLNAFGNMAVAGTDAHIRVEDVNETPGIRTMFELVNNGPSRFELSNIGTGQTWAFQTNNADGFLINRLGSGGNEFSIRKSGMVTMGPGGIRNFTLHPNGDLDLLGTLSQLSDRNAKRGFEEVDPQAVLDKVSELPILTWTYKNDQSGNRHMGPMAQDFREAFGLGKDETSIATIDTDGVALASIQALNQKCESLAGMIADRDERIAELEESNATLEQRLAALEVLVTAQQ